MVDDVEDFYDKAIAMSPEALKSQIKGIPPNHKYETLTTLLERLIIDNEHPNAKLVAIVLEAGADANGRPHNEGLPIHHAYAHGNKQIVDQLLRYGANPNGVHSTAIELAILDGDCDFLRKFLSTGIDVNEINSQLSLNELFDKASKYPHVQLLLITHGLRGVPPEIVNKLKSLEQLPECGTCGTPSQQKTTAGAAGTTSAAATAATVVDPTQLNTKSGIQMTERNNKVMFSGNTKPHQSLFRKYNGLFIRKCKSWIIPVKHKLQVIAEINALYSPAIDGDGDSATAATTFVGNMPAAGAGDAVSANAASANAVPAKSIFPDVVILDSYGPESFLSNDYVQTRQFYLEDHWWNSVSQYLMFKKWENSAKGNAIKDAESLEEAKRDFYLTRLPPANTPKQLIMNKRLADIVNSSVYPTFENNVKQVLYHAVKAKFEQNPMLMIMLKNTEDANIINNDANDEFGYESNRLGCVLMQIRDGTVRNLQTNHFVLRKYVPNKQFHVLRGDPDTKNLSIIQSLVEYKNKQGHVVEPVLHQNLQGGPGWLIPGRKLPEIKHFVFESYPDHIKIQIIGHKWIKKFVTRILDSAVIYTQLKKSQEIGIESVLFSVKDIWGYDELLGSANGKQIGAPHYKFIKIFTSFTTFNKVHISEGALTFMWDVTCKLIKQCNIQQHSYRDVLASLLAFDNKNLETVETAFIDDVITIRENMVLQSFVRLYRLFYQIIHNDSKSAVAVANIFFNRVQYEQVRDLYAGKIKNTQTDTFENATLELKRKFGIKNKHIEYILGKLPSALGEGGKIFFFTIMDYIIYNTDNDSISINKRIMQLCTHGTSVPFPTPAPTVVSAVVSAVAGAVTSTVASVVATSTPKDSATTTTTPKDSATTTTPKDAATTPKDAATTTPKDTTKTPHSGESDSEDALDIKSASSSSSRRRDDDSSDSSGSDDEKTPKRDGDDDNDGSSDDGDDDRTPTKRGDSSEDDDDDRTPTKREDDDDDRTPTKRDGDKDDSGDDDDEKTPKGSRNSKKTSSSLSKKNSRNKRSDNDSDNDSGSDADIDKTPKRAIAYMKNGGDDNDESSSDFD